MPTLKYLDPTDGSYKKIGTVGPQGPTGPAGERGPTGTAGGAGAQGAAGPTGPTGERGPTGPQGNVGQAGPTGAQGPQGAKGDQGIQGIQGIQGQGLRVASSVATTSALPAESTSGVIHYVQEDNNLYVSKGTNTAGLAGYTLLGHLQGPQGIQGPQGLQGATGATGATGPTGPQGQGIRILSAVATAGNLPSTNNQPGDAHLVTADGNLYVWGTNNRWSEIGHIQGPPGASGAQGPTGATGATGPAGPLDILTDVDVAGAATGSVLTKTQNGTWAGRAPASGLPTINGASDNGKALVVQGGAAVWGPVDEIHVGPELPPGGQPEVWFDTDDPGTPAEGGIGVGIDPALEQDVRWLEQVLGKSTDPNVFKVYTIYEQNQWHAEPWLDMYQNNSYAAATEALLVRANTAKHEAVVRLSNTRNVPRNGANFGVQIDPSGFGSGFIGPTYTSVAKTTRVTVDMVLDFIAAHPNEGCRISYHGTTGTDDPNAFCVMDLDAPVAPSSSTVVARVDSLSSDAITRAQADAAYLKLTGGTVTGHIMLPTLSGNVSGTVAARKDYVDGAVSGVSSSLAGYWKKWVGTKAQYDAIAAKDPNTLYGITG